MYGTQAELCNTDIQEQFENDVKMYGTQAGRRGRCCDRRFENDVKMYGTQAGDEWEVWSIGLRMM